MTHLNDSQLRAYLDGELSEIERPAVSEHLASCADCRAQLTEAETRAARINTRLNTVSSAPSAIPSSQHALARFRARAIQRKEPLTMFKSLFSLRARPMWFGLAMVAMLLLALSFAPVRALANELLNLFRVQQVTVLSIDSTRLTELGTNSTLAKQIGDMFSNSVTVTREASDPQTTTTAAEASQLAGFNVRLWDGETPSQLVVHGGPAFEVVIDRARAQAILDDAGRSDLQLPESLDGAKLSVDIPTSVSAGYGDCPKSDEAGKGGVPERRLINCVLFVQVPSPTVTAPPELDVVKLAEIGLQFTGMSAEDARAYSQSVDWTSTLVIPIPRNAASYSQVEVDGVTGTLIQRPTDDAPAYTLIWVKNGIVYAVGGVGSDTSKALEIANGLK